MVSTGLPVLQAEREAILRDIARIGKELKKIKLRLPLTKRKKGTPAMAQLRSEGVLLRVRLNHLIPVNRLPPETLCEIFTYCTSPAFVVENPSWLSFTHVCSHWRAIALASPLIWSDIHALWPEQAEAMLCRSKKSPVSVRVDMTAMYPRIFDWFLRFLQRESDVSRLRSLQILVSAFNERLITTLREALPAPLLEELSWAIHFPDRILATVLGNSFWQEIFNGNLQNLCGLRLTRVPFPSASPLPIHLKTLRLIACNIAPSFVPAFLLNLKLMVALESLELSGCFGDQAAGYSRELFSIGTINVHLPLAAEIVISDYNPALTYFLSILRVPSRIPISIEILDDGASFGWESNFWSMLKEEPWVRNSSATEQVLKVKIGEPGYHYGVLASTVLLRCNRTQLGRDAQSLLDVCLRLRRPRDFRLSRFLVNLGHDWPASINRVVLTGNMVVELDESAYIETYRRLIGLHALEVHGAIVPSTILALLPGSAPRGDSSLSGSEPENGPSVLFPALRLLTICNTNLGRVPDNVYGRTDHSQLSELLIRALDERRLLGFHMETLCLHECTGYDAGELSAVVVNLLVDSSELS